jgi:CBS-domain-containing membrane protein
MATQNWKRFRHFIGLPHAGYRANEQVLAALGGMVSILLVLLLTGAILGQQAVLLIVPSLGASAVLIFAVPHSPLTQPWAVLGGHLVSALIGVACNQLIPGPPLAAALAVGLAIGGMHLARCIHPPGGATALTAVIGGTSVHALGYAYALTPVAINCLVILVVGFLFNYAFPWRRYPASLMHYAVPVRKSDAWPALSEAQIEAAMDRLNVVIDINPEELGQVIEQAMQIAREADAKRLPTVQLGHIYCNDQPGPQWSVRQIVDERPASDPEYDLVIYQVLEGAGKNRFGSCPRQEFARWVSSELKPERSGG